MAPLIAVLTFLVVTVICLSAWLFAGGDSRQEIIRRRMQAVQKAERRGEVSLGLKLVRDEMLSTMPWLHRLLLQWSWSTRLQDFLTQAGMKSKPGKILLLCSVLGLGTYMGSGHFFPQIPLNLAFGLLAGLLPLAFIAWKRRRRMRQFEEHFPEALDLLGRAVRAGHAFTTGLEMIGKEAPEPMAGEFRTAFEEQNFGLPLRDALLNLCERVPLIDVRFFVTALLIQKETGGNLAEILDGLARVIRDRFRIYREVRTRTAQGRLTAGILIALPPIMMVLLGAVNPHYMNVMFTDPMGPRVLAIAATMQVIGSAILWKIIHIEV